MLTLDVENRLALRGNTACYLSKAEFALCQYLFERRGETVPFEELCEKVWNSSLPGNPRAELKILVNRLRRKIEPEPQHPWYVHTVRGIGYRLEGKPTRSPRFGSRGKGGQRI